jgi:hypothetical protein
MNPFPALIKFIDTWKDNFLYICELKMDHAGMSSHYLSLPPHD